jgi:hypothetical protein
MTYILDNPKQIRRFRLLVLQKGIALEAKGMKMSRGRSCLAIIKSEFGWAGNRATISARLAELLEEELRNGLTLNR